MPPNDAKLHWLYLFANVHVISPDFPDNRASLSFEVKPEWHIRSTVAYAAGKSSTPTLASIPMLNPGRA